MDNYEDISTEFKPRTFLKSFDRRITPERIRGAGHSLINNEETVQENPIRIRLDRNEKDDNIKSFRLEAI